MARSTSCERFLGLLVAEGQLPGEIVQSLDVILVRSQQLAVDRLGFGVFPLSGGQGGQLRP